MDLSGMYEFFAPIVGEIAGDSFDILRPDYSQVDNEPVLVQSGVRFRCDPVTGRFAEPRFEGVNYYDIFGPRNLLQPGDLLRRTTDDGMTPVITLAHWMPIKTTTGFRTSRLGQIIDAKSETPTSVIYDNVYFDFLSMGFPGMNLNRALQDSLPVPTQRVVLFTRENISRQRTHLVETDLSRIATLPDGTTRPFQRRWIIDEIDQSGNLMILTVRNK